MAAGNGTIISVSNGVATAQYDWGEYGSGTVQLTDRQYDQSWVGKDVTVSAQISYDSTSNNKKSKKNYNDWYWSGND